MSAERLEEILSSYADGKATPEELAGLESLLKADASLRREFVERMRLEVSLSALYESTAAAATPTRRAARPVRAATPSNRMAIGIAAAILVGVAIYAASRTRPEPAPRKESTEQEARVEPSRNPEEERVQAESDRKAKETRLAELRRQEEEAAVRERRKDEEL